MIELSKDITLKWTPMVDNLINIKNKYFKSLVCHYFDYLSATLDGDISKNIIDFKERIETCRFFKKEIKKEYINILTGRKEFLLENGTIFDPESLDLFLKTDELIEIFGIEFISHIDPSSSREFKINNILKSGTN